MNSAFLSALRSHGGPGTAIHTASGTIPANVHPPADSFRQGGSSSLFAFTEVKPVQVRLASSAPDWSSMGGAFFGNLFGSNRANTSSNVRESSGPQPKQAKSQATPSSPIAAPAHTKITVTGPGASQAQRITDSKKLVSTQPQASPPRQQANTEPPPDAGNARTTPTLLTGAVPTVPTGSFENRRRPGD
jgi:hypothetical protein